MSERSRKASRGRVFKRVLAGVLAVTLLGMALVNDAVTIRVSGKNLTDNAARLAVAQLLAEDAYANDTRLGRMASYLRRMLGLNDGYAESVMGASIAMTEGRFDRALQYMDLAIELFEGEDGERAGLYARKGYLLTLLEREEEALTWLNKSLRLKGDLQALLTRAQVRLNLADKEGALRDAETFAAAGEYDVEMLPYLLNIYEACGAYEKAAQQYDTLLANDAADNTRYYLNRAYCRMNMGQMEAAEADVLAYAQAQGGEMATAQMMLGLGWMRQREYARASACFADALASGYPNPQSLYEYIVLCAYVGGDMERVCQYGDALQEALRKGEYSGAAAVETTDLGALQVTLTETDLSSLCMMTGAAHLQREEYDKAADSLTFCLEMDGDAATAQYLRGTCFLAAGRYEEALVDLDSAIAAGEELEKSRYARGVCRAELGDTLGAEDDLSWVIRHGSDEALKATAKALRDTLSAQMPEK